MKHKVSTTRPGDSLYKQIETFKHDKLDDITTVPLATSLLLLMSILSYLGWFPAHNLAIVIIVFLLWLISIVYTARKLKTWKKTLEAYRKGLDGERYVGAILERFRLKGAEVFHDINFEDKYNIDHLVISTKGIFVIETKNYSKTQKNTRIHLEKGQILINGKDYSEIYRKVDSYANHLSGLIGELTGKEFKIQKVILFPGWYIEGRCATSDFWVLNEKSFMKFFENANLIYKESEIEPLKTQLRYWIVNHTEEKPLI